MQRSLILKTCRLADHVSFLKRFTRQLSAKSNVKLSPSATSSSSGPSHKPSSSDAHSFQLADPFLPYQCNSPSTTVTVSKEECMTYLKQMMMIRRMEMVADQLYKNKLIRGFCHLSIGQEAVAVGMEAAITKEDHIITAYRCHGFAFVRGVSIHSILAELLGKITGSSKGKGGSMHIFGKNFYGGNGIVGAQVPVGTGIAFAQKYRDTGQVTFALYGDGAANQGQVFEAYNMAALWKLPIVFVCENNGYGMGTSAERSSASTEYYKRAQFLPGVRVNGMDVLAVREASRFAKQWILDGKGPIVLDVVTYRYSGHSMSDPGTTYRTREEVAHQRETKDPINLIQKRVLDLGWSTDTELKELDRSIRDEIETISQEAQQDPEPSVSDDLWKDIYVPGTETLSMKGCGADEYKCS